VNAYSFDRSKVDWAQIFKMGQIILTVPIWGHFVWPNLHSYKIWRL